MRRGWLALDGTYGILPLGSQLVASIDHAGVENRLLRETRSVELGIPVNGGNLGLDLLVAETVEEVHKGIAELERVKRLVGPLGEVVGDELVKGGAADEAVQVVEEVEALLVGNGAVDVLGVDVVVADDELGVLVVGTKVADSILCIAKLVKLG